MRDFGEGLSRRGDEMKGDLGFPGEGGDRPAAVADQMIFRGDDARQRGRDRSAVILRQDGVKGRALPVAGDKNGNIVLMKARMSGLAAAFARPDEADRTARPLKDLKMNVSSASTISRKRPGLSAAGALKNR